MSDRHSKGGKARAAALTPEQRSFAAKRAANTRWHGVPITKQSPLPVAAKPTDFETEGQVRDAVECILDYITNGKEDLTRPGIRNTPGRVLKAWRDDWGRGYREELPDLTCFTDVKPFPNAMIVVKDITYYSHCEHHLAPFFGTVDIAYIPREGTGVLGLSKFARIVDHYSKRLQVQERLTEEIAALIMWHVSPDVAVTVRGTHMCMCSRGVNQLHSVTVTSALKGAFYNEPETRAEYYSHIKG